MCGINLSHLLCVLDSMFRVTCKAINDNLFENGIFLGLDVICPIAICEPPVIYIGSGRMTKLKLFLVFLLNLS